LLTVAVAIFAALLVPEADALGPKPPVVAGVPTVPQLPVPPPPVVTTPVVTTPAVTAPVVTTPVVTTPVATTPVVTTSVTPAVAPPAVSATAVSAPAHPSSSAPAPAPAGPSPSTKTPSTRLVVAHGQSPSAQSSTAARPAGPSPAPASVTRSVYSPPASAQARRGRLVRHRPTIVRFRLVRAGVVRVSAWQLAPRCSFVGHYRVGFVRGPNALRLPRRIGLHRLDAGTYHFVGVSRGIQVLNVRIRLFRANKRLHIAHDDLADVCPALTTLSATVPLTAGPRSPAAPDHRRAAAPSPRPSASPFLPPLIRGLNPANASPLVQAIIFGLLGCAIALLAAASLPARVADAATGGIVIARHRAAITLTGFAMFLAAALFAVFE
jgi:hypothetical protein